MEGEEAEKKKRGRKPKTSEPGEEPPSVEKKKRGRKHKPRVYKVTKLDDTITLFSEPDTSQSPESLTDTSGKVPPTTTTHHSVTTTTPVAAVVVNEEPSIIHLPVKDIPSQPFQIDYKRKIIVPEEPDKPITEKEYNDSISKRDMETSGLEKYISLNKTVQDLKPGTYFPSGQSQPQSQSNIEKVLQILEDPSLTTNDLREVFAKIKNNIDLDTFLSSNNFRTDAQTNPKFETLLDDTVRQSSFDYTASCGGGSGDIRKCWWCTHPIPEGIIPFPLPVNYNHATKKFKTKGYFCSPNCAMAYNNNSGKSGDNYLIIYFVRMQYDPESNISVKNLFPAPHWKTLKEYGGTLGIEEFRDSFYDHTTFEVLEYPMISHHILVEKTTVPKNHAEGGLRLKRTKPPPLTRVQQTF